MKKYMALYMGTAPSAKKDAPPPSAETREAGMKAWGDWMGKHAAHVLDMGGPLGKTLQADPTGVSRTHNKLTGYVIIQADSHEAAAAMFENHPHFTIFPGDAVEIVEILDMPGG